MYGEYSYGEEDNAKASLLPLVKVMHSHVLN